jgi:hypothetical protein
VAVTTSTTNSAFKIPFANTTANTTGNYGLLQDSTATFTYNPSLDEMRVGAVVATSGIVLNSNTISANFTLPANTNGVSVGPITINSGVSVTVPSGARYVVI